jgi:hypothetical protein
VAVSWRPGYSWAGGHRLLTANDLPGAGRSGDQASVPWMRYSSRFCSTPAVTAASAWRAPPPMGGSSTTLSNAHNYGRITFMSEHVKFGARQLTVDKQLHEGLFVHHAASGNVDQMAGRWAPRLPPSHGRRATRSRWRPIVSSIWSYIFQTILRSIQATLRSMAPSISACHPPPIVHRPISAIR